MDNLEKSEIMNMYRFFPKITDIIHSYLTKNKIVFVHCYAGKQRSASIVVAYLMKYLRITLKNSIKLLESKRAIVFKPLVNLKVIFIESCIENENLIQKNMLTKKQSLDYINKSEQEFLEDFKNRVKYYESIYTKISISTAGHLSTERLLVVSI